VSKRYKKKKRTKDSYSISISSSKDSAQVYEQQNEVRLDDLHSKISAIKNVKHGLNSHNFFNDITTIDYH
jgi:hypothetical protein